MSDLPPLPAPAPLSCAEAVRQMDCLVEEGALKPSEEALLLAHVQACADCRAALDRRRRLGARLRQAFSALEPHADFTERVLQAVLWEAPPPPSSRRIPALAARTLGGGAFPKRRRYRPLALLSLTAGLLLILWGLYGLRPAGDRLLRVAEVAGDGFVLRDQKQQPLARDFVLHENDVLTAELGQPGQPFRLVLESEHRRVAVLLLNTSAKLQVVNRHHFELKQGEAYFDVSPERPRAAQEDFDVVTPLGVVRAVGTAFGVSVPAEQPTQVTVFVRRGKVLVSPLSGPQQALGENEECVLGSAGGTVGPRPLQAGRLAWLEAPQAVAQAPAPPQPAPDANLASKTPPAFDWNVTVNALDFRGKPLPEALGILAERLHRPAELERLIEEARALATARAAAGRLAAPPALLIHTPLPLATVIRWLAREQGCWFEPPHLRLARADDPPLPRVTGALPPQWAQRLEQPWDRPAATVNDETLLAEVAESAEVNLLWNVSGPASGSRRAEPARPSRRAVLERAAAARGWGWAYADGVICLLPPAEIERLTCVPRQRDVRAWLGEPLKPEWAHALKTLATELGRTAGGELALTPAAPLLARVTLTGDRQLEYEAGLDADRALAAALALLDTGSPTHSSPAAVLDDVKPAGPVRDLAALAQLARERHVDVEVNVRPPAGYAPAFVNRSLALGEALEWLARLNGLGLRAGPGGANLVVDDAAVCYGAPALHVLNLSALAQRRLELARELPEALAAQIRSAFPELCGALRFLPLRDRLAFSGDRRQLAAAQRVTFELEAALRGTPPGDKFALRAWQPAAQAALQRNLDEPYQGDVDGQLPEGSCGWVLGPAGAFVGLRATLLVDPPALKRLAGQPAPRFDVRQKSLGQVLQELAKALGLRLVLEDGVVWLRE